MGLPLGQISQEATRRITTNIDPKTCSQGEYYFKWRSRKGNGQEEGERGGTHGSEASKKISDILYVKPVLEGASKSDARVCMKVKSMGKEKTVSCHNHEVTRDREKTAKSR